MYESVYGFTRTERWKMKNLKVTSKIFKAVVSSSSGHYLERLITNSCDYNGRHQFPPCEVGDLYRLDFAEFKYAKQITPSSSSSSSSSSSIGTTAHCGLWPVEQCPSSFSYLPPTLSIFSLPALEDLFLLPFSIFSWVFPFFSSLPVLE